MNKFVRTKSHTGSKFSKFFFEQLYTRWIVVVHLYCGFSLWRQMAPQQSAKFRTVFFGPFRTSLSKDSVANYSSIWTLFSLFVRGPDVLCNALNILQSPQQTAKFRTAFFAQFFLTSLRKDSVANYAWICTLFSQTVRGLDVLYNALIVS